MAETVSGLAYDEAVRAIASQGSALESIRSRAGTLLAAASLVTSFLGGQALAGPVISDGKVARGEIGVAGWIAVAMFVLVALFALAILFPYQWRFEMSAERILSSGQQQPFEEVQAALAGYHDRNRRQNRVRLTNLMWLFKLGCTGLLAETIAWIVELNG